MSLAWLSSGKIALHHSQHQQLLLKKKGAGDDDNKDNITLAELCRKATPETCKLNPFLFNGHLQTSWTTVQAAEIPIFYKRKIFQADDSNFEGHFAVDFVVPPYDMPTSDEATDKDRTYTLPAGLPPRTSLFSREELDSLPSDDSRPMLVVLHGLTGGSHEVYLRAALAPLVLEGRGWEACVVNARGCAQTKIGTPILFNARTTWDLRQVVKWLRKTFPNRPLFGLGFSLGANILTNYLGEEGENCAFKAAVVCANPWNLELSSRALHRTWLGAEVYSAHMNNSLKRLLSDHIEVVSQHPKIDVEEVQNSRYIYQFDRAVQAPLWGYPTEGAYYRDASSVDSIAAIRIPFLAINAEDDPISVHEAIPYDEFKQTPYGVLLTTSWGGHLGWFEFGGGRWFSKPIANFLDLMAKEIDLSVPPTVRDTRTGSQKTPSEATVTRAHYEPMRRKMAFNLGQK
ncbi:hypothetical protein VTN31DRAFT_6948 [Thermomyces dupontii]|uniref:uncharacterized protein n=1 Tax=Talaromyces thermophilus TaxID=28565 RepID=UPI0037446A0C